MKLCFLLILIIGFNIFIAKMNYKTYDARVFDPVEGGRYSSFSVILAPKKRSDVSI